MAQSTRTVLIIDGDAAMRYYHAMLLMRLQYVAMTDWPPDEALRRLDRSLPTLILSAFPAADSGGTDFLQIIRSKEATRNIPVIALLDADNSDLLFSCEKMGFAGALAKPADPHMLYRIIQSCTETTPRQNIRLNLSLKTLVNRSELAEGREQEIFTHMVSEGGFSVKKYSLPRHSHMPVRIFVKDHEVRTQAEVLYHISGNPGMSQEAGMGLKFIDITDRDRSYLRSYITEQLVHDIVPSYR